MVGITSDLLEETRLQVLYKYNILDTPSEEEYDRLTAMVARIFNVPYVMINLVDRERVWTKSAYGLTSYELNRSDSLCSYTIQATSPLIVPDTTLDPRFSAQPGVSGAFNFRFYAGTPLRTTDDYNLGTLCLLDTKPRSFSPEEQSTLQDLASIAMRYLYLNLCKHTQLQAEKTFRAQMEENLRQNQERLNQLVEISPAGILVLDLQGEVVLANSWAEQILDLTRPQPDQPYAYPAWKITDQNDNSVALEDLPFRQVLRSGQPVYNIEHNMEHSGGKWQIVSTNAAPLHDANGEVSGVLVLVRNITQRKWAEIERINLLKQEKAAHFQTEEALQKVTNILQSITDGFFTVDHNWRFAYVNSIAETIFGRTQPELLGLNIWETFPLVVGLDFYTGAQQAIAENRAIHFETFFEFSQKWFEVSYYPGQEGLSVYIRDINELKQAEEKLHEIEERLKGAFTLSAVGMALQAPNGTYIQVNQALCQMVGYSEEDLLQIDFQTLTHPDDLADILAQLQTLIEGQCPYIELEKRYVHKEGHIIWALVTVSTVRDREEQPLYYIIQAQDITKRKQIEASLRQSEGRLSAIINSAMDAIISIDTQLNIIVFNTAAEQMFGCSLSEAFGQSLDRFIPENLRHRHSNHIANFAKTGGSSRSMSMPLSDLMAVRANGEEFPIEATISQVEVDGRKLFTAIVRDITERKANEQALRESEERYRMLARNFPKGEIILFDKDLRFIIMEGSGLAAVGLSGADFVGKTLWEAFPPERAATLAPHYQAALAGQEYQFELNYTLIGKTYSTQVLPIKNEQGEIVAGMLVAQDITELTQATRQVQELNAHLELRVAERTIQLEAANQELAAEVEERLGLEEDLRVALQKEQELSELKSRFISMTSHEFRTPLSTIQANSELLQRYSQRWSEEKRKELFQRIQDATRQMTHLLDDVLLIGKAEAGKLESKPELFNLIKFCRSMIEEIKSGQGAHHEFNFVANSEDLLALLDEKLLRQIVGNLLSNAVKYSPPGKSIYFELVLQGKMIELIVEDQGIGIPSEDLLHLFEVFHRAKNVGTVQGTGLGLAIVKRSVELHDGTIEVESQINAGTRFTVKLPFRN